MITEKTIQHGGPSHADGPPPFLPEVIQLTFFEEELRKIVGREYPDATYVGRACYVRLSEMNRAKIEIFTSKRSGYYDSLRISILNRSNGEVDAILLRFTDLFSRGNYAGLVQECFEWCAGPPSDGDYDQLTEAVGNYLDVFQEQVQTAGQQWQQTM